MFLLLSAVPTPRSTPSGRRRHRGSNCSLRVLVPLVLTLLLSACGGGEPEAAQGPLEGRELSRAGQLEGAWMRVTPGPYLGFEFQPNDTAIVTHWVHSLEGETMTLQYSVLDGGRLSLVTPTGLTQVLSVVVADDALEITQQRPGSQHATTQRFRRLAKGQTLAAGLREHQAAIEQQRQERATALRAHLTAEDFVLKAADANRSRAVVSLTPEPSGQLSGTAVADADPSRHDPLQPIRVGPWQAELVPVDALSAQLNLRLTFDAGLTGGAGAPPILLAIEGSDRDPTIRGTGSLPPLWTAPTELVLVRDRSAHRQSLARLEEQREARRQALASVSDPLGGRSILRGQRTGLGGAPAVEVALRLEKQPAAFSFAGEATAGVPTFAATAQAEVLLGAGTLYVTLTNGEQWRLQRQADGTYQGPWRPNTRADFASHGEVSLELERMWTVAQVTAEREAMDRYVTQDLRQPTALVGFVARGAKDDTQHWPVWLELQAAEDGNVRGQAWLLGQKVGVEIEGRRTARAFTLQARRALPGSENDRSLLSQRWQLQLVSMDPDPRFEGRLSSNLGGGGVAVFMPLTEARQKAMRTALRDALQAPAWRVVNLAISRRDEPSHFQFDATTGDNLRGVVVGADLTGSNPSLLPPGLIEGEWAEERQLPVLRLKVAGSPDPRRGREGRNWDLTIAAHVLDGEPLLTGWDAPGRGNQPWLQIVTETGPDAVVVSPEQQLRIAAQRAGAVLNPPQSPTVGEEVLLLIHATERDARLGHIHYADGRYAHGNSIARAALHSGLMQPDEMAVVRLRFDAPHTAPTPPVEQNGITSTAGTFRPNNRTPTFRIERVDL